VAGYSKAELDDVQATWGIRFPPDLIEILRERRRLMDAPDCFDWVTGDRAAVRKSLAWPFDSYWRSVHRHEIWWPEWGERPASPSDRREKLRLIFADAPKLIPLVGIRYIPDEPHEDGNPIFSVMASDIVHYGANLPHWLDLEQGRLTRQSGPWPPVKEIRFWGQAVRYMNDESSIVRQQIRASIKKLRTR
jgi:hypothetical protein